MTPKNSPWMWSWNCARARWGAKFKTTPFTTRPLWSLSWCKSAQRFCNCRAWKWCTWTSNLKTSCFWTRKEDTLKFVTSDVPRFRTYPNCRAMRSQHLVLLIIWLLKSSWIIRGKKAEVRLIFGLLGWHCMRWYFGNCLFPRLAISMSLSTGLCLRNISKNNK